MFFDYYVDMNDDNKPVIITTDDLIKGIEDISQYPFRVKPFLMSGIWGGQFIKKLADLPKDMVNCAWSFEPIAPENSILLGYYGTTIEIPFLIILAFTHKKIMGERIVELFGDFFPIRFDYLDTIDGGSLSCQVHPNQDYIRRHFNEFLEQQESYYIMSNQENSKVSLGLTDMCEKEEFCNEILKSQTDSKPLDVKRYVNEWNSRQGDLFLIPPGTVHFSGKGNLVLEISATTWWYTFKIYDFLRKDLDGRPRPINIEHAFNNINFGRKTEWVKSNLIPKPMPARKCGENEEYVLGRRDDCLFYVNRIHLNDMLTDNTNGEFMILNLVEGEKVRIISVENESAYIDIEYAEAYIIPAVFGEFKLINLGKKMCKIIKAGVSLDWKVNLFNE